MCSDRDWIKDTIAHRQPTAVPYNFLFCPPARITLEKHYATEDLANALDLPIRMQRCRSVKPLYASPEKFGLTAAYNLSVAEFANKPMNSIGS